MKIHRSSALLALFFTLGALVPACSRESETRIGGSMYPAPPPLGSASLCGTVIDLSSGEVAPDVEVVLTGGITVRTDERGRFQIDDIALGTRGEVLARSSDGRVGTVTLLPLSHERREIELNLKAH
jgi:hypothetical protein